jgi:hypothetical protein
MRASARKLRKDWRAQEDGRARDLPRGCGAEARRAYHPSCLRRPLSLQLDLQTGWRTREPD